VRARYPGGWISAFLMREVQPFLLQRNMTRVARERSFHLLSSRPSTNRNPATTLSGDICVSGRARRSRNYSEMLSCTRFLWDTWSTINCFVSNASCACIFFATILR